MTLTFSEKFLTSVESKVRHVRTSAGERRFGQPIGSVITADGKKLPGLRIGDSDVDGWDLIHGEDGKDYYVGKDEDDGKWYATEGEGWDKIRAKASTQEDVYKKLSAFVVSRALKKPVANKPGGESRQVPGSALDSRIKKVESDYHDFDKYEIGGNEYYVDQSNGHIYDANDNVLDNSGNTTWYLNQVAQNQKPATTEIKPPKESSFKPGQFVRFGSGTQNWRVESVDRQGNYTLRGDPSLSRQPGMQRSGQSRVVPANMVHRLMVSPQQEFEDDRIVREYQERMREQAGGASGVPTKPAPKTKPAKLEPGYIVQYRKVGTAKLLRRRVDENSPRDGDGGWWDVEWQKDAPKKYRDLNNDPNVRNMIWVETDNVVLADGTSEAWNSRKKTLFDVLMYIDFKARHVRTAAGAEFYDQPIGSVIRTDAGPSPELRRARNTVRGHLQNLPFRKPTSEANYTHVPTYGGQGERREESQYAHVHVSATELKAVRKIAINKAQALRPPHEDEISDNKARVADMRSGKDTQSFRDLRGNNIDRDDRSWALYTEFGGVDEKGKDRGYVPCVYCGNKMSWHDKGKYPKFEQDKILTTEMGGKYRTENLLPVCSGCNKLRNDTPLWKGKGFEEAKPAWFNPTFVKLVTRVKPKRVAFRAPRSNNKPRWPKPVPPGLARGRKS